MLQSQLASVRTAEAADPFVEIFRSSSGVLSSFIRVCTGASGLDLIPDGVDCIISRWLYVTSRCRSAPLYRLTLGDGQTDESMTLLHGGQLVINRMVVSIPKSILSARDIMQSVAHSQAL